MILQFPPCFSLFTLNAFDIETNKVGGGSVGGKKVLWGRLAEHSYYKIEKSITSL